MAREFEIKIEGADRLVRAMQEYPDISRPIFARAMASTESVLRDVTLEPGVVPVRSGFLQRTFAFSSNAVQARWGPTRHYAPHVQFGTKPHVISPRNKAFLAWKTSGAGRYVTSRTGRKYYRSSPGVWVYVSKPVNHPGTKANPFMERILGKAEPGINRLFGEAGDLITQKLAG